VDAGSNDSTTPDTSVTGGFLPEQPERRTFESVFARVVATAGLVGAGTALGAILNLVGWITGLVVSTVTLLRLEHGARLDAARAELYRDANLADICKACNAGLRHGPSSINVRTYLTIV